MFRGPARNWIELARRRLAVIAYTDGSCLGNPGPGGWAWALMDGPSASGAERSTTNQRMELTAALELLQWMVDHIGDLASRHGDYGAAAGDVAGEPGILAEATEATEVAGATEVVGTFDQCDDATSRKGNATSVGSTGSAVAPSLMDHRRGIDPVRVTIISDSSYLVNCFRNR
ncbi:MAG: RNase H family protein [Acidimicrobiales bacterium]